MRHPVEKFPGKGAWITLGLVAGMLLFIVGICLGIVGISYRVYDKGTVLENPVKVKRMTGHEIELADGRVFTMQASRGDLRWQEDIRHSRDQVELLLPPDGPTAWIYGERRIMRCGSGDPLITIPLIPCRVRFYQRTFIATAEMAE